MTAYEFRSRVHDDIGPELYRPAQERCGEGIVDNKGYPRFAGYFRYRLYVKHVAERIADRLGEKRFCPVRNRIFEIIRLVRVNERDIDAKVPEINVELSVSAAVKRARRHKLVSRLKNIQYSHHLSGHSGRDRHRCPSALERSHPLFERGVCGVHYTSIDIAEGLEIKEARRVISAVEYIGGSLVYRRRASGCRRVRQLPRMNA